MYNNRFKYIYVYRSQFHNTFVILTFICNGVAWMKWVSYIYLCNTLLFIELLYRMVCLWKHYNKYKVDLYSCGIKRIRYHHRQSLGIPYSHRFCWDKMLELVGKMTKNTLMYFWEGESFASRQFQIKFHFEGNTSVPKLLLFCIDLRRIAISKSRY